MKNLYLALALLASLSFDKISATVLAFGGINNDVALIGYPAGSVFTDGEYEIRVLYGDFFILNQVWANILTGTDTPIAEDTMIHLRNQAAFEILRTDGSPFSVSQISFRNIFGTLRIEGERVSAESPVLFPSFVSNDARTAEVTGFDNIDRLILSQINGQGRSTIVDSVTLSVPEPHCSAILIVVASILGLSRSRKTQVRS
ncbi:hypothetical protein [Roseibacillus persicicus]|uniref:hypothetical protein n=1 Tax=Roseibacillus persicicus TaxID=454148 RepID=UPI00280FE1B9|nr:hypothetical protein [Roseibacillus persicicus]MDQ8192659.1 hypothetical protein [Roseibacillus persicicus]